MASVAPEPAPEKPATRSNREHAKQQSNFEKMFAPPEIKIQTQFPEDARRALVLASLACSSDNWQIAVPPLHEFSKHEILDVWEKYLKGEKIDEIPKFDPTDIQSCIEFDRDEDFILLSSLRNSLSFEEMMSEFGYIFKAFRSLDSIKKRADELKNWTPEEVDNFYNAYARDILTEEMFDLSTQPKTNIDPEDLSLCRCAYRREYPIKPTQESQTEVTRLMQGIQGPAFAYDSLRHVLAILRSETHEYYMKREALLIGRGTADHDVDIDLTFETDRTCTHISRAQAILSFMSDCNFYLENIGTRVFRVNGALIHPGKICRLIPGAILDFSGTLLMFIPNEEFVVEIAKAVDGNPVFAKKRL